MPSPLPVFIGLQLTTIAAALFLAYFRSTYVDYWGTFLCVLLMSIVSMVYIITGQFMLGKVLKIFPIAGYHGGLSGIKFFLMPTFVGILYSFGGVTRLYRTFMLEEMNQDYVRTARAKGVSEQAVLFKHVLKNAAVPIVTSSVAALPGLFLGSLLTGSVFQHSRTWQLPAGCNQQRGLRGCARDGVSGNADDHCRLHFDRHWLCSGGPPRSIGVIGTDMNTWISNLIPVVVVVVLVTLIARARRTPLWAEAYRRIGRNKMALVALSIICLYAGVAVLDSIAWQDNKAAEPKTILDRMFARVRRRTHVLRSACDYDNRRSRKYIP